jgi:hypothetical protein
MSQTRVLVLLAGAALGFATTASAGTTPDQDRAYAAELKADADSRTQALAGNGLTLAEDGNTKINLSGFSQFRYTMNWRDDPANLADGTHQSGFTNGFETVRTRLAGTGNIMVRDLTFKIEGQFATSGGEFTLLDAWGNYRFDNGVSVKWGQYQVPLWREWTLSPFGQLAADYSVTTAVYNPGYTQGVMVGYRNDSWSIQGGANDGINAANTGFDDPSEADVALTARVDFKGGGDWKIFDDFTAWRGQETGWTIGGAFHWENNGNTNASAPVEQDQLIMASIDGSYEGNGWNLYLCGIWNHLDPQDGSTDSDNQDNFGVIAHIGGFVTDDIELFARYDGVFLDDDEGGSPSDDNSDFNTITVGANYFPFQKSRAARFTADVQWLLEATDSNAAVNALANTNNNPIGILPSSEDNEVAVRLQFELAF